MYPVAIGLATAFPFGICLSFVITDFDAVISTRTGLPLVEVYYQATGSKAGTTVLMLGFALCFFGCAAANITSSSRQMWAASRDDCFPLSRIWRQVHPRFNMPFNAAILSGTLVSVSSLMLDKRLHICPCNIADYSYPAIWADLHWFFGCLLVHGRRLYRLHDHFVCHSARHSGLSRT